MFEKEYNKPESRKLEFKEALPSGSKIERTAVAFSNDAGGEIYIGIKNEPREITGIPENELIKLEEQINNIIYENCHPAILPDIFVQKIKDKYILVVKIPRGSLPPYYIKSLGKENGTIIRVGSSNRLADREIIEELERKRRNISYDSTTFYELKPEELILSTFTKLYREKTGKKINMKSLVKLGLIKTENEKQYPTVSSTLLSDNEIKQRYFPYAKIECARFIGTKTDNTLDSKTIDESICLQPDLAVAFVERTIKKGSKIGRVYREERWEYPMLAVRELIINAVIHRDYSLQGKDIKIAIFDDMLEITSPGTIPPSIDLNNLSSGQSEIRNKTLGPIFKELQLIEQWGTGFQKLSDELKEYPEIELKINEPGLSFQIQFIKKDYQSKKGEDHAGTKLKLNWDQVGTKLGLSPEQAKKALNLFRIRITNAELMKEFGLKNRTKFRRKYIAPLLKEDLISMTIPDKPNSPDQKYILTEKGKLLLDGLTGMRS
jgi:predicted HTH transcriptional regulator